MQPFEVTWSVFKAFVEERDLSIQWIDINNHYYMYAIAGKFELNCNLHKTGPDITDVEDFETNFKDIGNKSNTDMDYLQRMSNEGNVFATGTAFLTLDQDTETPALFIRNNSSDKKMQIFRAVFSTDSVQVRARFRFYYNPSINSDGTPVPKRNQRPASINTSEAETFQLPDVSSNGTFITERIMPAGAPTQTFDIPYFYVLDPGEEILFTIEHTLPNASSNIVLVYAEL